MSYRLRIPPQPANLAIRIRPALHPSCPPAIAARSGALKVGSIIVSTQIVRVILNLVTNVVECVIKGPYGLEPCQSQIGYGTTFRILLPTPADDPRGWRRRIGMGAKPSTVSARWLRVITVVKIAGSRNRRRHAGQIPCVLLDVEMPEMVANGVLTEF